MLRENVREREERKRRKKENKEREERKRIKKEKKRKKEQQGEREREEKEREEKKEKRSRTKRKSKKQKKLTTGAEPNASRSSRAALLPTCSAPPGGSTRGRPAVGLFWLHPFSIEATPTGAKENRNEMRRAD